MPNAEFNQKSEMDVNLRGLKNRGQVIVNCADCGKELMVFQIVKDNNDLSGEGLKPVNTKVVVLCGDCNGKSYSTTISGQFYPGAADDKTNFEPVDSDDDRYDAVFKAWSKPA